MLKLLAALALCATLPAQAANKPCAFDYKTKMSAACLKNFLANIPDEQDRSEARRLLSSWSAPAGLQVETEKNAIFATASGKPFLSAVWLKRANPAILWYDGEILVDERENPSLGRTIDNLLKKRKGKSAWLNAFAPNYAHAEQAGARDLLFVYTIGHAPTSGPASAAAHVKNNSLYLYDFLPVPLFRGSLGSNKVQCAGDRLLAEADVTPPDSFSSNSLWDAAVRSKQKDSNRKFSLKPKSPTEFVLHEKGTDLYQLIRLSTAKEPVRSPSNHLVDGAIISVHNARYFNQIYTCKNPECTKTGMGREFSDWRPSYQYATSFEGMKKHSTTIADAKAEYQKVILEQKAADAPCDDDWEMCNPPAMYSPEDKNAERAMERARAATSGLRIPPGPDEDLMESADREIKKSLSKQMIAMSIMGQCCGDNACRAAMNKNYGVELVSPKSNEPATNAR